MKQVINGILCDIPDEEVSAMARAARAQMLRERGRSLDLGEVLALLIPGVINTAQVDDNTALRMTSYYPEWSPGVSYTVGFKVQRNGKLWKVVQAHTSQAGWEPENVASLWTQICESHSGAEDDPIPYEGNMALVAGLYYVQDGEWYRCVRDTINPVYHALRDLVGHYVEVI